MNPKMFVNVAVKDLAKSKAFFSALGFEFNPRFTDDKAACMRVNDAAYVMLLSAPFFKTFTRREICDTSKYTEALMCLMVEKREGVDEMVNKAVSFGGSHAMPSQDHGFMYVSSFYDVDGHHWEIGWMDEKASQ